MAHVCNNMIRRRSELCSSYCNSHPHPNHLCCENTLSFPMSFAREAQTLLPDDFNLEDAVDATQTVAKARPLLLVGETLEDFGGQESVDDWLTRRFCEGRLSALQSPRCAAGAVRSGAEDDRVDAVAQGASQCSQNAHRSSGVRLPPLYWADVPLCSPLDARCACLQKCHLVQPSAFGATLLLIPLRLTV